VTKIVSRNEMSARVRELVEEVLNSHVIKSSSPSVVKSVDF
jgi:hypothetical protein